MTPSDPSSDNVVFTRTARCVKILGKGVVKVVHRCDAAKEDHQLGESIFHNRYSIHILYI